MLPACNRMKLVDFCCPMFFMQVSGSPFKQGFVEMPSKEFQLLVVCVGFTLIAPGLGVIFVKVP